MNRFAAACIRGDDPDECLHRLCCSGDEAWRGRARDDLLAVAERYLSGGMRAAVALRIKDYALIAKPKRRPGSALTAP